MNAMEKVAWTEVVVSTVAIVGAIAAYPWLGQASEGFFGILGFLVVGTLFLRKRGDEIVTDERDRGIEKNSTNQSLNIVWMTSLVTLIGLSMTFGYHDANVPTVYLNWLIWMQLAVLYLAKGVLSLRAYRGAHHASQG